MSLFEKNVQLGPARHLTAWRKIAIGTWKTAGDPSVYGMLELNAEPALAYIDKKKKESGSRITITHFVAKAMAETLRRHSDINSILRFGRIYPRTNIDIFFQVASDDTGKDLDGMTIRMADKKTVSEMANEMSERVIRIKKKGDATFAGTKKMTGSMPGMFSKYLLWIGGFIMYTLNLWTPLLGSPKDPFGSVMVTSIGSLGLSMAFAPLVPYSRIPLLVAVGAIEEKPISENGQVKSAKVITLCVTFDHRIIDGVHASHMAKAVKAIFADPEKELG